jgi:predicted lipid-binding transport protein (Tim44 family)
MTGQASGSTIKEHIWLVALYEQEARADELLERLNAIGVDTSEATTVRVEIDDQMRAAKNNPAPGASPLSPVTRSAVSGGLVGGAASLLIGIVVYMFGLITLQAVEGLFNHSILFVIIGATIGAAIGIILASAAQQKIAKASISQIQQLKNEGFLVAVKMPPPLAERAEEIARGLGAKEILL